MSPAATYPPSPWLLHGSMWVTAWWVGSGPARGLWGAAFVDYVAPSPLTYHELLVARVRSLPRPGRPATVEISGIWVDSPGSRDGGRALWAIPKHLAPFGHRTTTDGARSRTTWTGPGARARFTDVSRLAPRTPYAALTSQPPLDGPGDPVVTPFGGTARTLPCRAAWSLDADGPLAFLRGARQLASVRMADFAITFGR